MIGILIFGGFIFALVALVIGVAWAIVLAAHLVVQATFFLLCLWREHLQEKLGRLEAGVTDPHRLSWRFVRRCWRKYRAGVYDLELAEKANLR